MNPLALLDKLVNPLADLLEKPLMKKTLLLFFFMMVLSSVWASHVSIISFNPGDPLSSSDLNANFNGLAAGIEDNQTQITVNAGNIDTNSTDIGTNDGKISTNITNIGTNAGNITSNNTSIGTNAGDIKVNQGNISTNSNTISNVDDRVTNLEVVKFGSVTYAAAAFTPKDENYAWGFLSNGGRYPESANGTFVHAVTLPAGYIFTGFDIRIYDSLSNANITAKLLAQGSLVAEASSGVSETGGWMTKSSPNPFATVPSSPTNWWWLEVFISASDPTRLVFYALTLHYQYTP